MAKNSGKTAFLIVALLGSTYYGVSKYRSLTPSPAINNGHSDEYGGPRRDRGEKRDSAQDKERHERFAKMAQLTPQQEEQIKKLQDSGVDGRDRWTSMSQILTPEQRQRMSAAFQERRDRGAKAALSGSDFERYKEKREQIRAQRGGGLGGGRRGGQGGSK